MTNDEWRVLFDKARDGDKEAVEKLYETYGAEARRAYGADNKVGGKIQSIRVVGDGFDITVPRAP